MPSDRILLQDALCLAVRDAFPISPGHTLIIPKRHVQSLFDTTIEERMAMHALLDAAKTSIDGDLKPVAYNIGINDGPAAGQTVPHLHWHLIPRYDDDDADPRGGIRKIFPAKAKYWT